MNGIIDSSYDPLSWGSHLPALLAAIGASSGPVLELGIGHFSTPHLHALCLAMGRRLVSVEENEFWYNTFATRYVNGHEFRLGKYADIVPELAKSKWAVSFIDHSGDRGTDFRLLLPASDYVVVHDYHREVEEAIAPYVTSGFNVYVEKTHQPPTLIVSKYLAIPESIKP